MAFNVHRIEVNWNQELPTYWYNNSPFKTHFMNSLSTRFHYGEKFFIDTMRKFKGEVPEPLQDEVNAFIAQESHHMLVHKNYDMWLASKGYPASYLEHMSSEQVEKLESTHSKEFLLMITMCLEHMTTVFAEYFLTNPEQLEQMHPHFRKVWQWHAIEELEHTAVANNLLNAITTQPTTRRIHLLFISVAIMYKILKGTVILLKHDKQLWKWRTFVDGTKFLSHAFVKSIRPYWRFMNKNYTPIDYSRLLSRFTK